MYAYFQGFPGDSISKPLLEKKLFEFLTRYKNPRTIENEL